MCDAFDELLDTLADTSPAASVPQIAARHHVPYDPRFASAAARSRLSAALDRLAARVAERRHPQIYLLCHCSPRRCHADSIARHILHRLAATAAAAAAEPSPATGAPPHPPAAGICSPCDT